DASLLLKPDQIDLHHEAAFAIFNLIEEAGRNQEVDPATRDKFILNVYRIGLEHLETYLRVTPYSVHRDQRLMAEYFRGFAFSHPVLHETDGEVRDMILRVLQAKADAQVRDDSLTSLAGMTPWKSEGDSLSTAFGRKLDVIRRFTYQFKEARQIAH